MQVPLILLTNDDGIESAGLWAVAEALMAVGEVLVVAPNRQWSGGGRSMPPTVTGEITPYVRVLNGERLLGYAVDASPALAVQHGVLELASRRPSLVVSGVNYGYNLANEVTVSGTVGAALEGAAFGIPSMALSLEMDPRYHLLGDADADYGTVQAFAERFAQHLLSFPLPYNVDVLNINFPADATPGTPWRLTRLARQRFFQPVAPNRDEGQGRPGYRVLADPMQTRMDSDIWAVQVERIVSVTPLSLDLTAHVDLDWMQEDLQAGIESSARCLDSLSNLFSAPLEAAVP